MGFSCIICLSEFWTNYWQFTIEKRLKIAGIQISNFFLFLKRGCNTGQKTSSRYRKDWGLIIDCRGFATLVRSETRASSNGRSRFRANLVAAPFVFDFIPWAGINWFFSISKSKLNSEQIVVTRGTTSANNVFSCSSLKKNKNLTLNVVCKIFYR